MIKFTNIRIMGDYIYAVCFDMDLGDIANVKIHLTKEEVFSDKGTLSVRMQRAAWFLQKAIRKYGSIKIGAEYIVAWG